MFTNFQRVSSVSHIFSFLLPWQFFFCTTKNIKGLDKSQIFKYIEFYKWTLVCNSTTRKLFPFRSLHILLTHSITLRGTFLYSPLNHTWIFTLECLLYLWNLTRKHVYCPTPRLGLFVFVRIFDLWKISPNLISNAPYYK